MEESFKEKQTAETKAIEREFQQYYEEAYKPQQLRHNGSRKALDFTILLPKKGDYLWHVLGFIEIKSLAYVPDYKFPYNQSKYNLSLELYKIQKKETNVYFRIRDQEPGIYWHWRPHTKMGNVKDVEHNHFLHDTAVIYIPREDFRIVDFNKLIEQKVEQYGI